ncbi:MAG: S46 family peptidase [Acidobacteria bacterium]|nr:S46 family peptidase [Acidobacteriota bacterium]
MWNADSRMRRLATRRKRCDCYLASDKIKLSFTVTTLADEGMWPFNNVPKAEIKRRYGFNVTDAWLRKVQLASVRFNNGASGSFVSPDGLVLTNHHVASSAVQQLSTPGNDYIKNGFYARTRAAELKAPDLEINVLVNIEDVTARVSGAVKTDMTAVEANATRRAEIAAIEKTSLAATNLRSEVVTLYRGGQYHLYRYKTYTDVRVAFVPEYAIAFFGGDADNFTYPRYSLDIAFLRVYEHGKPLKADNHLNWSESGVRENELVFLSGHHGSTARLNTVAHLEFMRDIALPFSLKQLSRQRETLLKYSAQGEEQERRAREDLFGTENSLKRIRGQFEGLQNNFLIAKKRQGEDALRRQLSIDPRRQKEYGEAWQEIARGREEFQSRFVEISFLETDFANTTLFGFARTLVRLATENAKPNAERLPEYTEARRASLELNLFSPAPIYKDFEKIKIAGLLSHLRDELGVEHPLVRKILDGKMPEARAEELIEGTQLQDAAYRKRLAANGLKVIEESTDPIIVLARSIDPDARSARKFYEPILSVERANYAKIARALYEVEGTKLYPDATSTLRLSYGAVKGYREKDKRIPPFTMFSGLYQRSKHHTNQPPYKLPRRWIERKSTLELNLPLTFVTTNDSVGGCSGSPVVNKNAEIVGVIFDGNIQSLAGHFIYNDAQNRAIAVDSRGIIDALTKLYGATRIADELTK